jgi:hypothetical protein
MKRNDAEQIGGKLLNPIMSLFVSLGDSAMALLQKVVYGMDESLVNLNTTTHWWSKIIVVGITVCSSSCNCFYSWCCCWSFGNSFSYCCWYCNYSNHSWSCNYNISSNYTTGRRNVTK